MKHGIRFRLHDKQDAFIKSEARYRAFVGGRGSGKTYAGAVATIREVSQTPALVGMVVAPTYPMLRDAVVPALDETIGGLVEQFHKAEMRLSLKNKSQILLRSADNPDRLRGPNLAWCWLDEAAYISEEAWKITLATLRVGAGRAWITTTPKGYDWIYDRFVLEADDDSALFQCSTADNPHLGDFAQVIQREYGAGLLGRQEIGGEFVQMEGSIMDATNLRLLEELPVDCVHGVRYWDLAATEGGGDWTAGVRMHRRKDGSLVISDVIRGQWGPSRVKQIVEAAANRDGSTVRVRIEQEPGSSGKALIDQYVRQLIGFDIRGVRSTGKKLHRILPFAAQVDAGTVNLVRGPWVEAFRVEAQAYDGSDKGHDDQLDAAAGAMECLLSDESGDVRYDTVSARRWKSGGGRRSW